MRETCPHCRRPRSACYCEVLPRLHSRTRVVFLQHPRERRVAIGTARMAHLALPNSELHWDVRFDEHPRLQALVAGGGAALLFPGEGALSPDVFESRPLETLVVLDGTWPQARKMLKTSPLLQRLPRLGFTPRKPGNYRIRREPAADCLATIEAVAEVLGRLEGDEARFTPMLRAFDRMVDHQLACTETREGPPRRRRRTRPPGPRVPRALTGRAEDLLLLYAEANVEPTRGLTPSAHELIHLVAFRPTEGALFEAVLQPGEALCPTTAFHLELPEARFQDGEPRAQALARFGAFVRPTDLWCSWGGYPLSLLKSEGLVGGADWLDLRVLMAERLRRRPGALDTLAASLSWALAPRVDGRAGRRLAALERVVAFLQGA